jgi:hypothetical protein
MARMFAVVSAMLITFPAIASDKDWFAKAVKGIETKVIPAEAKPGETVTVRITVQLNDGYHTYPLVQPDPRAADQINKLTFPDPDPAGLIFVGMAKGPDNPTKKAEPALGIKEMHIFSGTATYERKAVVSPKASGKVTVQIPKFQFMVCDENNCFPPKSLKPEATVTISGTAVPVAKEYAAEVESALAPKK